MPKRSEKSATIQTELALSLTLCVVALFITIGAFNNQINDMMTSNNTKNLFNNQEQKTSFTYHNRDYSNSQVNVSH